MTFYQILTEAINDFMANGFDNEERLNYWLIQLRQAAVNELIPVSEIKDLLETSLTQAYSRMVIKKMGLSKKVSAFTVDKLKPKLRSELDKRILNSLSLIKSNQEQAVQEMLHRFQGWATSIPTGGTKATERIEEKKKIRKSLGKLSFEQRRVIIDQTHKLVANINDIVAVESGAIGARWHSNWKQLNYNYREDHKERDSKIYLIKDGWGYQEGYLKNLNGFTNDITMPSEEVYCRCRYVYLYTLNDFPKEFLTKKGEKKIQSTYK